MSAVLDRAEAHYEKMKGGRMEVPEWGADGKPLIITWNEFTVDDRDKIYKVDAKGRSPSGATAMIRSVMFHARDEAGKRLFDDMDEHRLRHKVSADVIGRISNAILYGIDPDTDDEPGDFAEKAKNA